MIELSENNLPISPMKKLKVLSENQNVQNNSHLITKYESNENIELKTKLSFNLNDENSTKISSKNDEIGFEQNEKDEPLLIETTGQYVIFPIKYDDMWYMYKTFVENFWSTTENIEHLESLNFNNNEIEFIKLVTAFFASFNSFGLVIETFAEEFSKIVQVTEAKFFYGHQLFVQNIHFEMYNRLIESLIKDENERNKYYDDLENIVAIKAKRNWTTKWSQNKYTLGEKLVASACLNGLLFTTIIIIQDWLKLRSLIKTYNHELIEIIDKMSIDLDLERDFSCLMLNYVKNKPKIEFVKKTIDDTIMIEKEFLLNGLKLDLINFDEKYVNKLLDTRSNVLRTKLLKVFDVNAKQQQSNNNQKDVKILENTLDLNIVNKNNSHTNYANVNNITNNTIDKNLRFDEDF